MRRGGARGARSEATRGRRGQPGLRRPALYPGETRRNIRSTHSRRSKEVPPCPRKRVEESGSGLTPATDGWFVVNVRDAAWLTHEAFGAACRFEGPRAPFPELDKVPEQLDHLQKDRQVLSGLGASVHQECKSIAAQVQGALRTLQSNAATNAAKKRGATAAKGKTSARGKAF